VSSKAERRRTGAARSSSGDRCEHSGLEEGNLGIGVWRGVSKGVEDGRRPPTLLAANPETAVGYGGPG
jgi:hypothetical protein